jgi:hypothetical protein
LATGVSAGPRDAPKDDHSMPQQDRFDSLPKEPGRVGAHRGKRPRGGGWIGFLVALLAIAVLTFGGLFAVSRLMGVTIDLGFYIPIINTPTPEPTFTPPPPVVTNPADIDPERGVTIIVLNGTPVTGLQTTVADELAAEGWPILTKTNAGSRDIEETVVYYSDPADEDVARGLVEALGVGEIAAVPADTYPGASVTIVLGLDDPRVPAEDRPTPDPTDTPAEG